MTWPLWILNWWKAGLGALVVFFPAFFLGQCSGVSHERSAAKAAAAVANVEMLKKNADITSVLDQQRRADDARVNDVKKELTNAVANLPDDLPSPRRVALACERLRQQGTDTGAIAACQ